MAGYSGDTCSNACDAADTLMNPSPKVTMCQSRDPRLERLQWKRLREIGGKSQASKESLIEEMLIS